MCKRPYQPLPPEDDGRTIAPMNIEGMPWQTRETHSHKNPNAQPLLGRDLRQYLFSAVGAGLLIVFLFGAVGAAFILFCTQIWFR